MKYGYINSGYDERDYILDNQISQNIESLNIPLEYDYTNYFKIKCKDQGNYPYCVPYSIGLAIEIRKNLNGISNFWIDTNDIFNNYGTSDGMMIRDAFKHIKNNGYINYNSSERYHIFAYGKLMSYFSVIQNVYINGPCIFALPVKDECRIDFWNGSELLGGHAICCVGYTKDSFILMNSWGSSFGYDGKCYISFDDFNKNILECWTFID